MNKNIYRTVDCGSLRMSDCETKQVLSGFVDTIRKLGGITFVVLRDFYGKTQIVLPEEMDISLNKEDVICVHGTVRERSSKNPAMPTGDIEILAEKVEYLANAKRFCHLKLKTANLSMRICDLNIDI